MKAILVINMPERCDDEQCLICYDSAMCSYLGRWMGNKTERPTDCPLRPIPNEACEMLVEGLDAMEKMKSIEVRVVRKTE